MPACRRPSTTCAHGRTSPRRCCCRRATAPRCTSSPSVSTARTPTCAITSRSTRASHPRRSPITSTATSTKARPTICSLWPRGSTPRCSARPRSSVRSATRGRPQRVTAPRERRSTRCSVTRSRSASVSGPRRGCRVTPHRCRWRLSRWRPRRSRASRVAASSCSAQVTSGKAWRSRWPMPVSLRCSSRTAPSTVPTTLRRASGVVRFDC